MVTQYFGTVRHCVERASGRQCPLSSGHVFESVTKTRRLDSRRCRLKSPLHGAWGYDRELMSRDRFQTAAVIGTGMMGPGIAGTLALGGVRATILSRTEEGAAKGLDSARRQICLLELNGLAERAQAARALELVDATSAFDATIALVDLVVESAPENMEFK